MHSEERRREVLRFVQANDGATVAELAERFGVSESTIRRDLQRLGRREAILRTHGGALPAAPEPPILQRKGEQSEAKQRIGRAAADLIADGETVFIGSGTTAWEITQHLAGKKDLTVITNALNVAYALVACPHISVIVIGGLLRHSELSMLGHLSDLVLRELHAHKAFMGVRAISVRHGLTNDYLMETLTDRLILQMASEVIIVADHTKFGKVSTVLLAPVTEVDVIVTDTGLSEGTAKEYEALGIDVMLV
ncbi:MAG: DeoR/GlpR family DNA-binding transcription regulator [Anaerolineae bacterium]